MYYSACSQAVPASRSDKYKGNCKELTKIRCKEWNDCLYIRGNNLAICAQLLISYLEDCILKNV